MTAGGRQGDRTPILQITNLSVTFSIAGSLGKRGQYAVKAVDDVSLTVGHGETVALVGESGSGKSTIARAVLGIHESSGGGIEFEGVALGQKERTREFRRQVQMIFQDPFGSLDPRMTVGKSVAEGFAIQKLGDHRERQMWVNELFTKVGLDPGLTDRYPHQLSGGQRQRVGIARAIALKPVLIVADEPVSALDVSVRAQIINLLADLRDEFALSFLIIAHDLGVVRHTSDRVAVMYLGKLMEVGPTDSVFGSPRHPYTFALLSADPVPDPVIERTRTRIILKGQIPSPITPPPGCRFSTRCWLREQLGNPEICAHEVPVLVSEDNGEHSAACHFQHEMQTHAESMVKSDVHRLEG